MKTTLKILTLVSFFSRVRRCRPRGRGRGPPRPGERAGGRREGGRRRAGGREDVLGVLGRAGVRRRRLLGHGRRLRGRRSYRGHEVAGGSRRDRHRGGGSDRLRREHGRAQIELLWHAQPGTSAAALIARR